MLLLVGGAFLLAGSEAALVQERKPVGRKLQLARIVAHAGGVSTLFTLLFADVARSCVMPSLFEYGLYGAIALVPGLPLTFVGHAVTSALIARWQRRDTSGAP